MADGAAITFGSLGRPGAGPHATHDLVLVAEAADRGGRLAGLQAACPDCLALHADLVLLAAALPDASVPARPRDFTLSAADAARLRPAGWRRWLAAIGTSRDAVSRPLAIGLTTLGLAGLLVASIPGALPGGSATSGAAPAEAIQVPAPAPAASAAAGAASAAAGAAVASAAPSGAPALAAPQPVPAAASTEELGLAATEAPKTDVDGVFSGGDDTSLSGPSSQVQRDTNAAADGTPVRDDASGLSVLFVLAGAMLIAGLGLFGLRWSARRG